MTIPGDDHADDEVAVKFGRGVWPATADDEDPFDEPDLLVRDTVPEPASAPPWRRVPRPPVWAARPVEHATGPVGIATTAEHRFNLEPARPDPPPEHPHRPRWANRAWLGLAAVAVLVLTVAAGLALSPRSTNGQAASAATGVQDTAGTPEAAGLASAAGAPSAAAHPTQPRSTAPGQARPVTVTYEAEANTLSGGAFVSSYPGASGGRVVKNLGDWKDPAGPGSVTFTNVSVPVSGAYTLRFYYVHVNGDATRTAVITVSGSAPIDVTVSAGSVCCARQAVVVHLAAGRNAISFGNPQGPAPAIDRMEIVKGAAG